MPGATVSAVAALASTYHWSWEYVYKQLPLSRAIQLLHCIDVKNPWQWTTRKPGANSGRSLDAVALDAATLARIANADAEVDLS